MRVTQAMVVHVAKPRVLVQEQFFETTVIVPYQPESWQDKRTGEWVKPMIKRNRKTVFTRTMHAVGEWIEVQLL